MLPILRNSSVLASVGTGPVNRLDSSFDRVFGDDGGAMSQAWSWAPVAMWQDDDYIFIEAEMPGLSDSEIEVTVHNEMLSIRGERKPEAGRQYLYNGRSYGRFERSITLPEPVRTDDVQATLTNGVLQIALPKSPDAKPKRIAIKAS
jgi:HSP20 family protein